jgi:predicted transcriptional regulator
MVASSNGLTEFDWEALVGTVLHPVKVAIIEALHWTEQPLSSTELVNLFSHRKYSLGVVSYHVTSLAKFGVIEMTGARQARGARETYYYLTQR